MAQSLSLDATKLTQLFSANKVDLELVRDIGAPKVYRYGTKYYRFSFNVDKIVSVPIIFVARSQKMLFGAHSRSSKFDGAYITTNDAELIKLIYAMAKRMETEISKEMGKKITVSVPIREVEKVGAVLSICIRYPKNETGGITEDAQPDKKVQIMELVRDSTVPVSLDDTKYENIGTTLPSGAIVDITINATSVSHSQSKGFHLKVDAHLIVRRSTVDKAQRDKEHEAEMLRKLEIINSIVSGLPI